MRFAPGHLILLFVAALLVGCSTSKQEPEPAPQPARIVTPAPQPPPVSGNWTDWPITPGDWVYRSDGRGSLALFGQPGRDAVFMIRCDRGRNQIFLSRAGSLAQNTNQMTLRASSGLKSFVARNSGGSTAYAAVAVPTSEYMLDRIAYSRGRFAVETTGLRSIAIPVWPEFTRVVEDCRS